MKLLDEFSFREQITRPNRSAADDEELPNAILNYNSLEALRRAFVVAIKSIEIAADLSEPPASAGGPRVRQKQATRYAGGSDKRSPPSQPSSKKCGAHLLHSRSRSALSIAAACSVLEATDVRGLRFRVVFIAGLVEGGFPLRASRDWIYPHEERERLKRYGLTLEDISPATLLKEEHYFYQAACRATERLYLSRPLVLADDSETVASYYIDELRRAVSPFKIEAETIRRDYEGKSLEKSFNYE